MDQKEYYRNHPPRCIAGFGVQSAELPEVQFDGHPSFSDIKGKFPGLQIEAPEHINTIFLLSCRCGSDKHHVIAHAWANPEQPDQFVFLSPIALRCVACRTVTELLDTAVHGHDAELGNGSATMRAQGKREEVECAGCDLHKILQVFVRFEYPDDLLAEQVTEHKGRQQDLFTWFSLVARCAKCGSLLPVADYECA
ncbi:MAG TPA: hypothetical protein VFI31_14935 [Pirellulales bacterium]|nr:hypothetical protein [Pirellulales bacterium]